MLGSGWKRDSAVENRSLTFSKALFTSGDQMKFTFTEVRQFYCSPKQTCNSKWQTGCCESFWDSRSGSIFTLPPWLINPRNGTELAWNSHLLALTNKLPRCVSCLFSSQRSQPWEARDSTARGSTMYFFHYHFQDVAGWTISWWEE